LIKRPRTLGADSESDKGYDKTFKKCQPVLSPVHCPDSLYDKDCILPSSSFSGCSDYFTMSLSHNIFEPNRFGSDGCLSEMAQFFRSHAAFIKFSIVKKPLRMRILQKNKFSKSLIT
jgi:hypothetical protein